MSYLFTSESVSEGHPDKVADQISDAILDAYLERDRKSRVAVETLVTTNYVFLAGEVGSNATVDHDRITRDVIREIGYTDPELDFAADTVEINCRIHGQSPELNGVGAGDQGMMFGYACKEHEPTKLLGDTPMYMPLPIMYAHGLVRELAKIRKTEDIMPYLRPDAKSQVTVEYDDTGCVPRRVNTIVLSTQHARGVDVEEICHDIRTVLLPRVIDSDHLTDDLNLIVNPKGSFVTGGPHGDTGLTGRKIIVDTYGGRGAHGGGAFSGKDATKVDRSAAYAARYVAKNIVAAGLAECVELQFAYAIGRHEPVSVYLDTSGTRHADLSDAALRGIVLAEFDLRPAAIIERLGLRHPVYRKTASYGHFGRLGFPWENLDVVQELRR